MEKINTGICVGLRFRRSQIRVMRRLREQLSDNGAAMEMLSLLDKAIESTLSNEAVEVYCTNPDEAKELAAAFVLYGIAEPAIEFLSDAILVDA